MNLVLQREILSDQSTIGKLSIVDGGFIAFTLEDVLRDHKIDGITAIPAGRYRVVLTMSQRFKKVLPILLDVPNFTGIRIHSGNTSLDTEGCILVGMERGKDCVLRSREALKLLMEKLEGEVWITILNPKETQMNWFQKVWNNPNAHIALGTISGVAATVFPEYSAPLATAAAVLGGAGIALPEQPKTEPIPTATPISIPQGTMHGIDYANLAAALIQALAKKK